MLVFGDFQGSSDTEGQLYVGGNAVLNGYSVGEILPVDCTREDLVVAGSLNMDGGRVYSGNIVVGNNAFAVPNSVRDGLPDGCQVYSRTPRFEFTRAQTHYQQMSTELCGRQATGQIEKDEETLSVTHSNTGTEIFELQCSELSEAFSFSLQGMSESASVIVNVRGDGCVLDTAITSTNASNVLFNLCDARRVTIGEVALEGSLLAPFADMVGSTGVIKGQIVTNSFHGETQQNHIKCGVCTGYGFMERNAHTTSIKHSRYLKLQIAQERVRLAYLTFVQGIDEMEDALKTLDDAQAIINEQNPTGLNNDTTQSLVDQEEALQAIIDAHDVNEEEQVTQQMKDWRDLMTADFVAGRTAEGYFDALKISTLNLAANLKRVNFV